MHGNPNATIHKMNALFVDFGHTMKLMVRYTEQFVLSYEQYSERKKVCQGRQAPRDAQGRYHAAAMLSARGSAPPCMTPVDALKTMPWAYPMPEDQGSCSYTT